MEITTYAATGHGILKFPRLHSDPESPGVEADGRGAVGKGAQTEGAAEVRKEGAGGGDAPEAEGEERHVGPGERDINAYKGPRKVTIIPL